MKTQPAPVYIWVASGYLLQSRMNPHQNAIEGAALAPIRFHLQ